MKNILSFIIQIDSLKVVDFITKDHAIEFILLVLAAIIGGVLLKKVEWLISLPNRIYLLFKNQRNKNGKSVWKFEISSKDIKPDIHLNISDFKKEFFEKDSFEIVKQKFFEKKRNLIIEGRSGIGKTRSAFELLSKSRNKYTVLIPRIGKQDSLNFETSFRKRKKVILLIDDLQKYDIADINFYLENLIPNSSEVKLLITCRTEHESIINNSFQISDIERYKFNDWTINDGKSFAMLLNKTFDSKTYDNTPISVLLQIGKLKERYKQLERNQVAILECIKLLKTFDHDCNSGTVKNATAHIFELSNEYLGYYNWRTEIKKLIDIGYFKTLSNGEFIISDLCLNDIIEIQFYSLFNRYFNYLKANNYSVNLFYCGLYFEKKGDNVNAEKCYIEAIKIYPSYASAFYRLGSIHLSLADKEEYSFKINSAKDSIILSIAYFLDAVKYKTNDYTYFNTLGYAYSKAASIYDKLLDKKNETQNLLNAIENFNKAIRLNSTISAAYRMKGFCNFQLQNYTNALADYKTAEQLDSSSPHIYYLLGLLYDAINEEEMALNSYRHCIELNKEFYQAHNNIAHIFTKKIENQKLTLEDKKIFVSDSIKHYLLSIWYSKGLHYVAYSNLGHLYGNINEYQKAIKVQTIVIKKSPEYSEPYVSRGYAYNHIYKYTEAEKDLLTALKLKPIAEGVILDSQGLIINPEGKTINSETIRFNSEGLITNIAFTYQKIGSEKLKSGNKYEANANFQKAINYYNLIELSKNIKQKTLAKLGIAITYEKMNNFKGAIETLNKLISDDSSNSKKVFLIYRYFIKEANNEKIKSFIVILVDLIKQKEIQNIGSLFIKELYSHIKQLSKNKLLSHNLTDMVELLKVDFPNNSIIYLTSGILYLNRANLANDYKEKMNFLLKAENDLNIGKSIAPEKPVFLKNLNIANAKKCIALKEEYNQTKEIEYLSQYDNIVITTKKMFEDSESNFPEYSKLKIEHCIFLYSLGLLIEGNNKEKEVLALFAEKKKMKTKNDLQIEGELKELVDLKMKLKISK